MCEAPILIPVNGFTVPTPCHKCMQCRDRKVTDYVGRNIAESKTALASHAMTLTYGRDEHGESLHERSQILTYTDVQKFIKLLRRHGYPVRYFITGEYGSKWGRSHWHVILYWQKKVPPGIVLDDPFYMFARLNADGSQAVDDKGKPAFFWPHGFAHVKEPSAHNVMYNCKYIQKDMGDDLRQGHLAMSKKPPIGYHWFRMHAGKYVKAGLAPRDLKYSFPDITDPKTGLPWVYYFTGRSAELFLESYIELWRKAYPGQHWPRSELVDLFDEYGRIVHNEDWLKKPNGI